MASILYYVVAGWALLALAQADGLCNTIPCGATYGREVETQEIYVPAGEDFYITPPKDICGPGVLPLGFTSKVCASDSVPQQTCMSALQELIRRTGNPSAPMTLKLTVYCPIAALGEPCIHCPQVAQAARARDPMCPYCSRGARRQMARPGRRMNDARPALRMSDARSAHAEE